MSCSKPQRERWQPLRLGLVELFHYDSEDFWFRDGHLLLRGYVLLPLLGQTQTWTRYTGKLAADCAMP